MWKQRFQSRETQYTIVVMERMSDTAREAIPGNVRAELSRHLVTQAEVSRALGRSRPWVRRRWSGEVDWSAGDLVRLAEVFALDYAALYHLPEGEPHHA